MQPFICANIAVTASQFIKGRSGAFCELIFLAFGSQSRQFITPAVLFCQILICLGIVNESFAGGIES